MIGLCRMLDEIARLNRMNESEKACVLAARCGLETSDGREPKP
jgi:predicted Fe-S protein YdhL (DUF1289 family)